MNSFVLEIQVKIHFIRNMRNALMVGISGKTGMALMQGLVNSRHFKKVTVLTRRENRRLKNIHLKKVTVDFASIENYKEEFLDIDDVFCLLGTDYINTNNLEDAAMFEYEYPIKLARVAKEGGVKNFFLLNSTRAHVNASQEKLKLRAKLVQEIEKMDFENLYQFKVNGVANPVNIESSFFVAKKSLATLINLIGMGVMDKIKITPANLIANKMIEVAISNPLEKKEFLPSDF